MPPGRPHTPSSCTRLCPTGALNGGHLFVFLLANFAFYLLSGLIVLFWAQALASRRRFQRRPARVFSSFLAAYGLAQVAMLLLYCTTAYKDVLLVHSVTGCLLNFGLAAGFLVLWAKLARALKPRPLLVAHTTPTTFLMETSRASAPLNDARSAERDRKMAKITAVAVVCATVAFFRAAMEVYQCICLLSSYHFPRRAWWLFIFVFFFVSEVLTPFAVLLILRHSDDDADGGGRVEAGVAAGPGAGARREAGKAPGRGAGHESSFSEGSFFGAAYHQYTDELDDGTPWSTDDDSMGPR